MGSRVELSILRISPGFDNSMVRNILNALEEDSGPAVIISPGAIFDEMHLSMGIMHAARSIVRGRSRARDPSMEILRCLAGAHQISTAVKMMGPREGSREILLVQLPKNWPDKEDARDPPLFGSIRKDIDMEGIEPLEEIVFGDMDSLNVLGIPSTGEKDLDRMAVLQHLSSVELD